ncbi:MAG: sigma-54-dependent transcriptional regulator [Gammaproteobacteria bacterium]
MNGERGTNGTAVQDCTSPRVLVVEDEPLFAKAVSKRLERAGFACELAPTLAQARDACSRALADLILLDMRLPDGSGLDFLAALRGTYGEDAAVIVLTAYGELEDAVAAMKLGASDYLKKPIDLDELVLNVRKVLAREALTRRLEYSRARERAPTEPLELIGSDPALEEIRVRAARVGALVSQPGAPPPTVLILGETGTGKDLVARLLHRAGARRDRPFVHVDCAALPKDLIEAELFGHEKGAFTSAVGERTGLIEAAEDGTVFLDEIGELPAALQTKLLAVLERRMLRRVGSSQERATHAWFIAATNRDVEAMVAQGLLRPDLYYRLNVLTLQMPPLRGRAADIELLARHFVAETARRYGVPVPELSASARRALTAWRWPGNVRELRHVIERAVLLAQERIIEAPHLGLAPIPAAAAPDMSVLDAMTMEQIEKQVLERALARTGGNVSEAARQLGITRMAMRYRMRQHGL